MSGTGGWHVVFDCNVALNIRRGYGRTTDWDELLVRLSEAVDGTGTADLQSVAFAARGHLDATKVIVWSNDHIVNTVIHQAMRPMSEGGLGLSREDALDLVETVIASAVRDTAGGVVPAGRHGAEAHPPLDHEDGMVYGLCHYLAGQYPLDEVLLVTNDRGLLHLDGTTDVRPGITVLTPTAFSSRARALEARAARRRMGFGR
jgi:hypothetical protein